MSTHADTWEMRIGLGQTFWGVVESINVIDIVNQSDLVEGAGRSAKLGQAMLHCARIQNWRTVDLYLLLGFRERIFIDDNDRPHQGLVVDTNATRYKRRSKVGCSKWKRRIAVQP